MANFTLVLGGAASGKSAWAEKLLAAEPEVIYLATLVAKDQEMVAKVKHHQKRRPAGWKTIEIVKPELPKFFKNCLANYVLVEDFGTYAAQVMESKKFPQRHLTNLVKAIAHYKGNVVGVSQEVGFGIVPFAASGRQYRELLGWLNQQLASVANKVYLVVAGQAVLLKDLSLTKGPTHG